MLSTVKKYFTKRNEVKSPVFKKGDFAAHCPIHSIENGFIFSKDGMVSKGYRISEPYYEQTDEAGYKKMTEGINLALAELPPGSFWHRHGIFDNVYYNERSKNYDFDFSKFFDYSKKEHLLTRPILAYEGYLFIGVSANPKLGKLSRNSFNTTFALMGLSNEMANIDTVMSKFDAIATRVLGRLTAVGVQYKEMADQELKGNFYKYFNLDRTKAGSKGINNDFSNKYPYYQIGNKVVGMTSYDGLIKDIKHHIPNLHGVTASFNHRLYHSLQIPHIVNQYVIIRDNNELLEEVNQQVGHFKGAYEDEVANRIEGYVKDINETGDRLVEFGTNVIVHATTEKELALYQDLATSAIKSLGDCDARNEVTEDLGNLFFSSVPGAIHQNYRTQIMPISKVGSFLQFSGEYYDKGNFLVKGRDGRPVFMATEPDDLTKSNNGTLTGPTGSGKSYLCQALCVHNLEKGDEMLIVDKGGSYSTINKIFGGKLYDFEDYKKVNLNFFPGIRDAHGKYLLTETKKVGIKSQFRVLWKFDKAGVFTSSEESVLDVIIELFYEMINQNSVYPNMDLFVDFVKNLKDEQILKRLDLDLKISEFFKKEDLLLSLSKYTTRSGGAYSSLYNGNESNQIDFSSQFTLFDVRNVSQDPLVFSLFNVSLLNLILDKVYGRIHIRKHVWMDECSEVLKTQLGDLLRVLFREIRKENGDVLIITQLITDITETPNGKVILDNAINKYILDHALATNSLPALKDSLKLTDHQYERIISLNKIPSRVMREFAILREGKLDVFGLEMPEMIGKAFSTDPVDRVPLQELLRKNNNPMTALYQYIENLKREREQILQ